MRGRAIIAAVLSLGAVVALGLPAVAAAKPGYFVIRHERTEGLELHGSNGYLIDVSEFAGDAIQVEASKELPNRALDLVSYGLLDHQTRSGLDFNLGGQGDFHLRFVAHKRKEEPFASGCKGEPTVVEEGVFVGTINFHGRRGFTDAEAKRAPGLVTTQGHQVCRRRKASKHVESVGISSSSAPRLQEGDVELLAGVRPADSAPSNGHRAFEAASFEPLPGESRAGKWMSFLASDTLRQHGVSMFSSASVSSTAPATFQTPEPTDPTSTATVEPPAPFSGAARFSLNSPTQADFTGDLAVELPGFGRVPLTGSDLYSAICEASGCTKTLPKINAELYGPGFTGYSQRE